MDCECSPRIASGLAGGLGGGEVCGAVTGGTLAIGLLYGEEKPDVVGPNTEEFIKGFTAREQALRCFDLIGFDINAATSGEDFSKVMELLWFFARGGKKVCNGAVGSAVRLILEQWDESGDQDDLQ